MFLKPSEYYKHDIFMTELDSILCAPNNNNEQFLITVLNIKLIHVDIVNKEHLTLFLDLTLSYSR